MVGEMLKIRGKDLYVEEFGLKEKEPVLYLHGGPGESCFDFTFHQKHRLQNHLRLIAIDQRGVCRSEIITTEEKFGLMDIIEDCEALRKHLNIKKWSLIGHSFGGFLALLYTATYPNSINKVIFECPTFDFELTSRFLLKKTAEIAKKYGNDDLAKRCIEAALKDDKSPQQLTEEYGKLSEELSEKRMEIYRYINDNPSNYNSEYTDEEWDEFFDRSEIHYNRLCSEGEIFKSLLPKLKEVKNHMLLITTEFDAATCEKHIDTFKIDAAYGLIIHFKNCGHTPHYEDPDNFQRVILDFLLNERGDEKQCT